MLETCSQNFEIQTGSSSKKFPNMREMTRFVNFSNFCMAAIANFISLSDTRQECLQRPKPLPEIQTGSA